MGLHFLVESSSDAGVGDVVALTGAEARHAAVVRRLHIGEVVTVGDGAGVWLTGAVEEVSPTRVEVRVAERVEHPPPSPRIILVQALAKGGRDELAVQAACELGVDEIVPWQASRSVSRWEGPKAVKGRDRWASIIREATKQAHRVWLAEAAALISTNQLAERVRAQRVLLLDPTASVRLSEIEPDGRDLVLVVGPEGGVSAEEIEQLTAAGAERVLLGDTVLRTSTAGPAAIAVLSVALGRW